MSMCSHFVSVKIAEARSRGALDHPATDEARTLAQIEGLLRELATAERSEVPRLRAQLGLYERMLADIFERTGQSMLADVLWDATPSYDSYC